MERWTPKIELTPREEFLMKRLTRTKKLFAFLRLHRHAIFDDAFQQELEAMYRDNGAGLDPKAPALLAMALVLQAYAGASDAEAVELTVMDLRWQWVLDGLGADAPLFAQGTLQAFCGRLSRTDTDRRVLERTAEWARTSGAFDPKKLPKTLRLAVDAARAISESGRTPMIYAARRPCRISRRSSISSRIARSRSPRNSAQINMIGALDDLVAAGSAGDARQEAGLQVGAELEQVLRLVLGRGLRGLGGLRRLLHLGSSCGV